MLVGYCVDNSTHSKGVLSSNKADGKLTNVGFLHENKFERTLFLQDKSERLLVLFAGCTSTNNITAIIAASESKFSTSANKNPDTTAHQRIYTPLSTIC